MTVHRPHPALPSAEVSPIPVAIHFRDGPAAERLVAGLPAAARAVREVAAAGFDECRIHTDDEWRPSRRSLDEIERLAKPARVTLAHGAAGQSVNYGALAIPGEELINPEWTVLKSTAKPGDGIVSRTFNRPISRFISRRLLKIPLIRPSHATLGTALIALAMMAVLLGRPSELGLIIGATLFQCASIFDGVDGEIARATFRTSPRGAMLDSLVDAVTNLGFIAGVVQSLYRQGDHLGGLFGLAGLAMLTCGLCVIGLRAKHGSDPFTFNAVKDHMNSTGSPVMQWLTWLTMRDFYALAAAVLIAAGLVHVATAIFAVVVAGWLVVVLVTSLPGFRYLIRF
ncbi:MAG: CDP-alcohol phosphatidyltransferase family protein [Novosphingobium sp.]|nr:CDP-alcohol phosphatidyltransferase family protein [Novosphingobium sp.]